MMTNLKEISLALTSVLLLAALLWSVLLRRKVKEQAERIRRQLLRETALQKKHSELIENANDVIYTHDLHGHFTSLNHAAERVIGYSRQAALGMSLRDFVAPEHRIRFDEWLKICSQSEVTPNCELDVISATSKRSTLEVCARLLKQDGQPFEIEGIARDITERKKAQEALRQSEERFSSAFRVSPAAIAICSVGDHHYQDVNDSFVRMFGYEREELIGRTGHDLGVWYDSAQEAAITEMVAVGQSVSGMECHFKAKSGKPSVALVFIERIQQSGSASYLFVAHDMTDRLTLETRLREAMKMEAVGRLAAGVAHDFNNLLTVIQGHTALALMGQFDSGRMTQSLEAVSSASERAAHLVRQLLTFSRKQAMQQKMVSLNEVINNSTKMLGHMLTQNITLKFHYSHELPPIVADVTMLDQILMNLTVNARDAMPSGGSLIISTALTEVDAGYVKNRPTARAGKFVCLTVTDTGCGMDAATQARIFEPFFTTKEVGKGTGLGLATVYGIAKQHEGWVEVNSEVGRGTTFRVYLPTDKIVDPVQPNRPVAKLSPKENQTILLVEDDPKVCDLVRVVLTGRKYRVLEARDGIEAMQLWNEQKGDVDLLFTDIMLGNGMSGIDLAENLRALKPGLRTIYTSGYSQELARHRNELDEGVNFLAKPHNPPSLLKIVERQLSAVDYSGRERAA